MVMKLRYIKHFVWMILAACNILVAIGFLLSAYSPYINPVHHPVWACAGLFFPIFICLNVAFLLIWLFVKPLYALFPLVIFLMGLSSLRTYTPFGWPDKGTGEDTIKVLTYNTQGILRGNTDDMEERRMLDYLKDSEADIICLQEYIPGRGERQIKKMLSGYSYYKRIGFDGANGVACFSRYPIISAERINYRSSVNGSALFRLRMGKDTLVLINNHLESNKLNTHDKELYNDILKTPREDVVKQNGKFLLKKLADAVAIRAFQADTIARTICENRSKYMVVCGDFNDSPVSYAHRVVGKGLSDAYVEAGSGPGFSYNQNHFYFRIDHIFVSKSFKVLQCEVDRTIDVSDHYPVWCLLEKAGM